ncbi:MAG TPA: hypothetical protein VF384_04605 [Planctomycetota bacterium]
MHRLFATASITLAGMLPLLAAQEPPPAAAGGAAPSRPGFDVSETLTALARRVHDTPVADHTVASAAWLLLAFAETGSTMRAGNHRTEVRFLTKTLIELQGAAGQFAKNGAQASRSDQIAATLAIVLAYERSQKLRSLQRPAQNALEAVLALKVSDAEAPTNEEVALLTLLLRAQPTSERLSAMAKQWVGSQTFGKTRRGDAALHLGQLVLGEPHPPELTVARTWPASLTADPLHTVLAILAVSTDEKSLARQSKQIEELLALRVKDGPSVGMWPAAGGFDEVTTTAMFAFAIGVANGSKPK